MTANEDEAQPLAVLGQRIVPVPDGGGRLASEYLVRWPGEPVRVPNQSIQPCSPRLRTQAAITWEKEWVAIRYGDLVAKFLAEMKQMDQQPSVIEIGTRVPIV